MKSVTKSLTRFIRPAIICLALAVAFPVSADELQEAQQLSREGKQSQALERINQYLTKRPKDAQARFLKGMIYTEQGKTLDAIRMFQDLTIDYPDLPEPYNNLAVLYFGLGQYDKARAALETAIRTHPAYATAHENLGDVYAKMASQAYDKALQLDRSNANAQTKLALVKDLFSAAPRGAGVAAKPAGKNAPVVVAAAPAVPVITQPAAPVSKPTVNPVAIPPANPVVSAPQKPAAPAVQPVVAAPAVPEKPAAKDSKPAAAEKAPKDKEASKPNPQDVIKAANAWARAWSNQSVSGYLGAYDKSFKPDGESRSSWEKTRKERIQRPKSIKVQLSNHEVRFKDAQHASVTFRQSYESDSLKSSTRKTLEMVKSGDRWLITDESTR